MLVPLPSPIPNSRSSTSIDLDEDYGARPRGTMMNYIISQVTEQHKNSVGEEKKENPGDYLVHEKDYDPTRGLEKIKQEEASAIQEYHGLVARATTEEGIDAFVELKRRNQFNSEVCRAFEFLKSDHFKMSWNRTSKPLSAGQILMNSFGKLKDLHGKQKAGKILIRLPKEYPSEAIQQIPEVELLEQPLGMRIPEEVHNEEAFGEPVPDPGNDEALGEQEQPELQDFEVTAEQQEQNELPERPPMRRIRRSHDSDEELEEDVKPEIPKIQSLPKPQEQNPVEEYLMRRPWRKIPVESDDEIEESGTTDELPQELSQEPLQKQIKLEPQELDTSKRYRYLRRTQRKKIPIADSSDDEELEKVTETRKVQNLHMQQKKVAPNSDVYLERRVYRKIPIIEDEEEIEQSGTSEEPLDLDPIQELDLSPQQPPRKQRKLEKCQDAVESDSDEIYLKRVPQRKVQTSDVSTNEVFDFEAPAEPQESFEEQVQEPIDDEETPSSSAQIDNIANREEPRMKPKKQKKNQSASQQKKASQIPKPKNAYMIFKKQTWEQAKDKLGKKAILPEINSLLAQWWGQMSDEEKAPYKEREQDLWKAYYKANPDEALQQQEKDARKHVPKKHVQQPPQENIQSLRHIPYPHKLCAPSREPPMTAFNIFAKQKVDKTAADVSAKQVYKDLMYQ